MIFKRIWEELKALGEHQGDHCRDLVFLQEMVDTLEAENRELRARMDENNEKLWRLISDNANLVLKLRDETNQRLDDIEWEML